MRTRRVDAMSSLAMAAFLAALIGTPGPAAAQESTSPDKKPNILVIMSDDVGITNLSAYSRGLVGYQTPNIDRIANEGV